MNRDELLQRQQELLEQEKSVLTRMAALGMKLPPRKERMTTVGGFTPRDPGPPRDNVLIAIACICLACALALGFLSFYL